MAMLKFLAGSHVKWGVGIFLTVLFLLFVTFYTPQLKSYPIKRDSPDFQFHDVIISQLEEGILKWEIQADEAEIYNEKALLKMKMVSGDIYQNLEPMIRFIANASSYDISKNEMMLTRVHVDFLSKPKFYLKSEELFFNVNQRIFIGKRHNKLSNAFLELSGENLYLDLLKQKLKMTDQAKATFYPEQYAL